MDAFSQPFLITVASIHPHVYSVIIDQLSINYPTTDLAFFTKWLTAKQI